MSDEIYIKKLEKINKQLQAKVDTYEKYSKGDEPFIKELQKSVNRLLAENKELKQQLEGKNGLIPHKVN